MNKNPEKIKEMFDEIATVYDFNNAIMSFGQHKRIKEEAVGFLKTSGKILDLCTGTGDIAGFLSKNSKNDQNLFLSEFFFKYKIKFISSPCSLESFS